MNHENATKTVHANANTQEESTMNKSKKKTAETETTAAAQAGATAAASTAASGVPAQLQAIESACGYEDPLTDAARKTSENVVRRVPQPIVDRVIALAGRQGGTVAGITFDATTAKAALAEADAADAVATAGLMLVRRAQDHAIRLRASIAGTVSAVRTSLRGYVKTAQGAPLAQEADELRSLAKQHAAAGKARKTRVLNEAAAASTPPAQGETPGTEPAAPTPANPGVTPATATKPS